MCSKRERFGMIPMKRYGDVEAPTFNEVQAPTPNITPMPTPAITPVLPPIPPPVFSPPVSLFTEPNFHRRDFIRPRIDNYIIERPPRIIYQEPVVEASTYDWKAICCCLLILLFIYFAFLRNQPVYIVTGRSM